MTSAVEFSNAVEAYNMRAIDPSTSDETMEVLEDLGGTLALHADVAMRAGEEILRYDLWRHGL